MIYKRVDSNEELDQIIELQKINIRTSISEDESKSEGFVTVHHDFEILKAMNGKCAHIIAKSGSKVIGYALCMLKEFKENIEVLKPMFQQIDKCLNKNKTYLVMGQICVDKAFRKRGVFRGMYDFMKQEMSSKYDMIITEVDEKNTRSLNAHYTVGFKLLYSYNSSQQDWALLVWDWN
ncbi:GNAT family N-acetyltransferase [Flavobacteriaceae bacterium PRS1]|nr:GNAT family N-acetyltransferase [Flavobacteriaceae bacterium PRS1]